MFIVAYSPKTPQKWARKKRHRRKYLQSFRSLGTRTPVFAVRVRATFRPNFASSKPGRAARPLWHREVLGLTQSASCFLPDDVGRCQPKTRCQIVLYLPALLRRHSKASQPFLDQHDAEKVLELHQDSERLLAPSKRYSGPPNRPLTDKTDRLCVES
jgi:hypothetical protein